MATIRISMKDYAAYQKALGGRARAAVERGVYSGVLRCLPLLHARTRKLAHNIGYYLRAWKAERIPKGARVHNVAPYAGVIEWGRRKGARRPPIEPLVRWAQRKLGLSEKEARGVAFAIATAIKKRGLPAKHVLTGAAAEMRKLVGLEVERELKKEMGRL